MMLVYCKSLNQLQSYLRDKIPVNTPAAEERGREVRRGRREWVKDKITLLIFSSWS
jgi:hypothetical protein